MTIRKMWGRAAAGEGSGVGLGLIVVWVGWGVCFAGAWAVGLGAQAARRQADMTRATNRIRLQPTSRGSRRLVGKSLERGLSPRLGVVRGARKRAGKRVLGVGLGGLDEGWERCAFCATL